MMEASSPLAAMRAPSYMSAWGRNDMYTSHPHAHQSTNNPFASNAFDFGGIMLKEPERRVERGFSYFNMNSVRGSSPTASLAADLSQNFHIDSTLSPQQATPRRCLNFRVANGNLGGRDCVTTPPIPSSSPGPMDERMDISPLPHKPPFCRTSIEVQSPTPQHTPDEEFQMPSSPPVAPRPTGGMERRKSILRTKGLSMSGSSGSRSADSQLPPFRFGAGSCKLSTSNMSLTDCFMPSPVQERRPQSANSPSASALMGFPRPSKPFGSMSNSSFRNGSPLSSHLRKPSISSNPLIREKKRQVRRSLSLFDGSDMFTPKKDELPPSNLHTVMDIDELHQPALPHFFDEGRPDSIPRITKETLLHVLDGGFKESFDQQLIIDCRFEYEYEGGHINGAVNYNDKELLTSQLFETAAPGRTLLIFHCEYSAHRAPIMARHLRKQDRDVNAEYYPRLSYPEVYILDGGYSSFFAEHRGRCFPQSYVEMDDAQHHHTCEREMGKLRQNRNKLSRAQTFAFGQHGHIDDSPTAPRRSHSSTQTLQMMVDSSQMPQNGHGPGHTRRMVSY